jgi:hypothetical protein
MAARRRQDRVLLPGEREGRRGFLKKGLLGGAILAVGGAAWLATRKTRPAPELGGPFQVLSAAEATVVLAAASRFIPEHWRFPGPGQVGVPRKVDAILEMADPATQKEVKRLLGLLENALAGLVLDGQFRTFTASPPEEQDRRLQAWAASRLTVRRTGFRALQKMVFAAYYASPETYGAVGYPGPPGAVTPSLVREPERRREAEQPAAAERPPEPAPAPRPRAPRPPDVPAPRPLEEEPAPRTGVGPAEKREP